MNLTQTTSKLFNVVYLEEKQSAHPYKLWNHPFGVTRV